MMSFGSRPRQTEHENFLEIAKSIRGASQTGLSFEEALRHAYALLKLDREGAPQ